MVMKLINIIRQMRLHNNMYKNLFAPVCMGVIYHQHDQGFDLQDGGYGTREYHKMLLFEEEYTPTLNQPNRRLFFHRLYRTYYLGKDDRVNEEEVTYPLHYYWLIFRRDDFRPNYLMVNWVSISNEYIKTVRYLNLAVRHIREVDLSSYLDTYFWSRLSIFPARLLTELLEIFYLVLFDLFDEFIDEKIIKLNLLSNRKLYQVFLELISTIKIVQLAEQLGYHPTDLLNLLECYSSIFFENSHQPSNNSYVYNFYAIDIYFRHFLKYGNDLPYYVKKVCRSYHLIKGEITRVEWENGY